MAQQDAGRRIVLLFILLMAWMLVTSTSAQMSVTVRVSSPITDQFPEVTLFIAIFDGTGRRIPDLPTDNFSVFEDETPISDIKITETEVGTRQVFVLNTSADMKIRDSHGQSRFDLARQALLEWWQLPSASVYGLDDLYLLTSDGVLVTHTQSAAEMASTLDGLTPAFEDNTSGYDLLLEALNFTNDPSTRVGMPTHLIFITSLLRIPRDLPLGNIIARARETNTNIYPILLGQPENLELPEAGPLQQIAEDTGGQFILFDPSLRLKSLASQILGQRTQYQLTYTSRAVATGTHNVQVQITGDGLDAFSDIMSFEIEVLPPEVVFIQPPEEITRQTDDPNLSLDALPPTTETLQILVTFPDGHPRPLKLSLLSVDGELIISHERPPFETFEWDLSTYSESETHKFQAIVEDSLGLQGVSSELPILIEVRTPPRTLATIRPVLGTLLAALAVLITGIVLAVSLINMGRQRLITADSPSRGLLQRKSRLKRAGLRQGSPNLSPEAHLVPVDPSSVNDSIIPLTGIDFILGRDPSLTSTPLTDPSVAGMHARLIRQVEGSYLLRDQGSIAGTWINYSPVPEEGQKLRHGDLIHIGRVALRFQLSSPPPPPEIRIRPVETTEVSDTTHKEIET